MNLLTVRGGCTVGAVRGGYRAWVSALACLACAGALSGCPVGSPGDRFPVFTGQKHYVLDEWDEIEANYRAFLKRRGGPLVGTTGEVRDPRGVFKGSARVKVRAGGGSAAGRLLAALDRARTAGKITGAYRGANDNLFVKGLVLLHGRGATGSLCLSYSGKAIRADQLFKGQFKVLGGTRKEARLHGSGNFLSLQPNQLKSYEQPFSLYVAAGFKHASVGNARGLPTACRNAGKPFPAPPPPKDLKASFDGFAFGPASARGGSLPAGTTVYSSGANVTDNGTCGQDLFGVVSYSGPSGGHVDGLADSSKFDQDLGQGRNDVPLLSAPADGDHTFKGQITAPHNSKSVVFTPALTLSRNC
jgi:hypothetical protein